MAKDPTLIPFLFNSIEACDILLTANANAVNIPARTTTNPTASAIAHGSSTLCTKYAKAITTPTRIPSAIAMSLIPSALNLNAKLFAAFEKFRRDLPVFSNNSPRPSNGEANLSKVPASFLTRPSMAALTPTAKTFFQSMLLNDSFNFSPSPAKNSRTSGTPAFRPIKRPAMINPPIAMNTFEGE